LALIIAAACVTYGNALHNEFHLDDFYRVVDNPGVERLSPVWRHFVDPRTMSTLERITAVRPMLPLTLSINYSLAGHSVVGYHLGNLLFHIIAGILAYFLCLELLRHWLKREEEKLSSEVIALSAALLFTVHPVSGISVNYISARDLILMQVFLTAAFLCYIRMRRLGSSFRRWAMVLVLLELSLLSKTNPVVAPLLVLAFELTAARQKALSWRPWLRAAPLGGIVLLHFAYTKFFLGFSDVGKVVSGKSTSFWIYPLTQAKVHVSHYLWNFVWPFEIRQDPYVDLSEGLFEQPVLLGVAVIFGSAAIAWFYRREAPILSFCVLAYWTLLLPTSSIIPLHHIAVAYRPYPSSVYLFLLLSLVAARTFQKRTALGVLGLGVVYAGISSAALNRTWRTEETLWTHSVTHGAGALAYHNYARSISDDNDPRVRSSYEEALRINPGYILAKMNLGLLLIRQGEKEEGLSYCQEAVAIGPKIAQSHYLLARAYAHLDRQEEAAESSALAANLDPRSLKYQYQAGLDAQRMKDYPGSLVFVRNIEAIDPFYRETLFMKGFALQMSGDLSEAIAIYETFLEQEPRHAQVIFNISRIYAGLGRQEEATQASAQAASLETGNLAYQYQAGLDAQGMKDYAGSLVFIGNIEAVDPFYRETLFLKGFAIQMSGNNSEAIPVYEAFIEREPRHAQALFNLAWAHMTLENYAKALPLFERTLAIRPDYAEAQENVRRCREAQDLISEELLDEDIERLEALGYIGGEVPRTENEVIRVHDPERVLHGYNFYIAGHGPQAYLMTMDGEVVHEWHRQIDEDWLGLEEEESQTHRYEASLWRRAHLYPNGDILAVHNARGMIKLDKNSELLWQYGGRTHHDMDVLEDGTIYTLTSKYLHLDGAPEDQRALVDSITLLTPEGKEIRSVSILEAIENSNRKDLLAKVPKIGDVLHTNSIHVLDGRFENDIPEFKAGNVMVSLLVQSTVAVFDLDKKEVVWTFEEDFKFQHEPKLLDNGHLLMFDNLGPAFKWEDLPRDPRSRQLFWVQTIVSKSDRSKFPAAVREYDLLTRKEVWSYRGTKDEPLSSKTCSAVYRFSNGNTLIVESTFGRALEVTPEGEIVWDFVAPHMTRNRIQARLFDLQRIPTEEVENWLGP